MRASATRRGMSPLSVFGLILITLVIGGFACVGSLWALGVEMPWMKKAAPKPKPTGTPIFLSSRPIPAYTKVTRDFLFDAKTAEPSVGYFRPDHIKEHGFVTDVTKILGRVMARDKAAGYAFTEKDFFPEGTRPGVVAGIPPGKRMFVLPADKVTGMHSLKAGDHFDLIGTIQVDMKNSVPKNQVGMSGAAGTEPGKRAVVRVLVQNGAVVTPVSIREVPSAPQTPGHNDANKPKPVHEITVAIDPVEVAPLTEALALNAQLLGVARSGRPEDTGDTSVTPGPAPAPRFRQVETVVGPRRQILAFPKSGEGPQEPPSQPPPTASSKDVAVADD